MTKTKAAPMLPPAVDHLPILLERPPCEERHEDLMSVLYRALTAKRPHGGTDEARLAAWMALRHGCTLIDGAGNIHFDRRWSRNNRTLFTAHTDTVHSGNGANSVRVDGKFWRADGDALGADDGAGMALIAHMLSHGVPGYYILFRGEECGGVGSSWLADTMPDLLQEFDRAVAFDRAGYYDVITHQRGGRCCSDAFAEDLAVQLSDLGLLYAPCDGGIYTDTAEFIGLIPECTNLSVGYKAQHGDREEQDVEFLTQLADAVLRVQWDTLPTVRTPGRSEYLAPVWWTDRSATDATTGDWRALDDGPQEQSAYKLLEALQAAVKDGDARPVARVVAGVIKPESPDSLMWSLNSNRLRVADMDEAVDMLYDGFTAEEVAEELYAVMVVH